MKEWTIEACQAHPAYTQLIGPGGFVLTLSPVAAELYHMMRFSRFVSDADARALLRRSCSTIAQLLGSSRAFVMPELSPTGFFEGLDLTASEAQLRREVGAPATTWEELLDSDYYGPRSWYVETFADLR